MRKSLSSKALIILFIALIFSMYQETSAQGKKIKDKKTAAVKTKSVAPDISYMVSMSKPFTHLLEVEMRLKSANLPAKAEIKMPVWTPGSYLIREYARHVQDFAVKDASGNALPWQKINKNTWQIDTKGANELVINYNVYANELTVRTNELNSDHAFFTNAAVLMFPKGFLNAPSTVKVVPFGDWKIATGLPKVGGQTNTFRAENFDILYDSPFEVGNFEEVFFSVKGKPHRFVIEGEGNYDLQKLTQDTAKIIEEGYNIFGELPYDNYLFILNLRGGGGLEHLNSTALQWQKFGFKPESRYKAFLNLVAHEYFHLWNVKRIRPDALGPFDYETENYTKLLWVAEGATSHYEAILLRRAGLISDKEVLESKVTVIKALQNRPGRFETSLEDASFDAWIKYYRQDENAINNQISYYDKGELVNFLLDIEIRTASNGAKSLDDVMRYLYNEFYKKNKNYTPEDYQKIAEMMAGKSLNDFFSKYVRGTTEIDYNSILNGIGLKLVEEGGDKKQAYLGANLAENDGKLTVRALPSDTPAYRQGLNTGDQIVAIDGNRASQSFLQSYLSERKPGDKVKLTIFRFDTLRELEITLGGQSKQDYAIVPVENPTEQQKRLYKDYLLADLK
ncbi:MAG: M61 family metallopeptidase [Acidobacteria bacterium]|nr:M61 family metallopeptidase [Acidobacteriota bacterium]